MEKSTNNKKTIIFYALTSLILICIIGVLVFIANKHLSSIKNDVNNMINLVKMQIKRKIEWLYQVPL